MNNRLQAWRNDQGYTLGEVSGITGLSISMLSLVERGKRNLKPATKILVARRLGVPVSELFDVDPIDEEAVAP